MFVGRIMQHSSNHIMVELVDTSHTTEDNKQLIMVLKSQKKIYLYNYQFS